MSTEFIESQRVRDLYCELEVKSSEIIGGKKFYKCLQLTGDHVGELVERREEDLTPIPLEVSLNLANLTDEELHSMLAQTRAVRLAIKDKPKGRRLTAKDGKVKIKGAKSKAKGSSTKGLEVW